MLAAPGMIGKSYAAKSICKQYPSIACLENDALMHQIFALVYIPEPKNVPLNEVAQWQKRVNDKADCNHLIRLCHRDWVARHWKQPIVLAEGYAYMLEWYREQVCNGLAQLGYDLDFRLLKYSPPIEEQAKWRAAKYKDWEWKEESTSFHIDEIQKQWMDFEPVKEQSFYTLETVDALGLQRTIESILNN